MVAPDKLMVNQATHARWAHMCSPLPSKPAKAGIEVEGNCCASNSFDTDLDETVPLLLPFGIAILPWSTSFL